MVQVRRALYRGLDPPEDCTLLAVVKLCAAGSFLCATGSFPLWLTLGVSTGNDPLRRSIWGQPGATWGSFPTGTLSRAGWETDPVAPPDGKPIPWHPLCWLNKKSEVGNFLLSQEAALQVPSADTRLTAGFGMFPGIPTLLWSPTSLLFTCSLTGTVPSWDCPYLLIFRVQSSKFSLSFLHSYDSGPWPLNPDP